MAAKVPRFGSWEGGENYTACFDNARKTKSTGSMINPNDPEQNPDMFPQNRPPRGVESQGQQPKMPQFGAWDDGDGYTAYFETARKTKSNRPSKIEKEPQLNRDMNRLGEPQARTDPHEPQSMVPQKSKILTEGTSDVPEMNRDVTPSDDRIDQDGRSKVSQFGAWDGKEAVQYTDYFDNARKNRAELAEPQLNRNGGERARPTKVRSEENMGRGGMRSNYDERSSKDDGQLQNVSRGSKSAGSEKPGRQTPGGQSPLHLRGKPQTRPGGRGSQTPERGTTIPPFGVWHKDPAQAEGFTGPFIRSREDRMTPLNNTTPAPYNNQSTQNPNQKSKKKCCCLWF